MLLWQPARKCWLQQLSMTKAVKLVDPINKFFEDVMVMDEDVRVKNNRLALLAAVKDITHAVGDLSVIVQ